jgi:DNA-binding transcriptional ArsR family regulator
MDSARSLSLEPARWVKPHFQPSPTTLDGASSNPRRSGELANACAVSSPVMSRHLRRLRASGLVETLTADEPHARLRVYRLRPEPFVSLKD